MRDDNNFEDFFDEEMNHGRGHTMWPEFDKLKTQICVFHFLWDEGYINEGEFKPEVSVDEVNDAIESEFGIKNYFADDSLESATDDMLNDMRNFAEAYMR